MTDQFNKLADDLDATATFLDAGRGYDAKHIREAAALLRAAAGVDAAGLSNRIRQARILACGAWSDVTEGGTVNSKKCNEAQKMEDELCAAINALESALRLVLAQRVPPGCVVVPVERLTVEEIKTLRQQVRNDPRCQDEHWFVLMARAIEDRYLAAALTDQSQKKESP